MVKFLELPYIIVNYLALSRITFIFKLLYLEVSGYASKCQKISFNCVKLPWITILYLELPSRTYSYLELPWICLEVHWVVLKHLKLPWFTINYLEIPLITLNDNCIQWCWLIDWVICKDTNKLYNFYTGLSLNFLVLRWITLNYHILSRFSLFMLKYLALTWIILDKLELFCIALYSFELPCINFNYMKFPKITFSYHELF